MSAYQQIVAQAFGGPEVLHVELKENPPEPRAGEARIRVEAAGVGYTDTILRRGRYLLYTGGLPLTPGYDVVGIVDAVGPDVTTVAIGERVADMPVSGAYSAYMIRPASDLVPVPAGLDPTLAVDVPLMWVTAWQMLTRIAPLPPGSAVLVVGASGAVGRALVLLGRHLGLKVIGTCSAGNGPLVERLGGVAIDRRRPDLAAAIESASPGGVAAAFDAIGGASWDISWGALARNGKLVAYGFQDFLDYGGTSEEARAAMTKLEHTWPTQGLQDGTGRSAMFYDINVRRGSHPDDYREDAIHLLGLMASGAVLPEAPEVMPLAAAAQAHRRVATAGLQSRIVLQP